MDLIKALAASPHTTIPGLIGFICFLGPIWFPAWKEQFRQSYELSVSYGLIAAAQIKRPVKDDPDPNQPPTTPSPPPPMNKVPIIPLALLPLALAGLLFMPSCSTIAPGADPIEVRAEQAIAISSDTFDELLQLDYANAGLIRSNAPAVHKFCEYLRQPVRLGAATYARDIAIVMTANTVRQAYKANRSPENKANLVTALATIEAALAQAQFYMTQVSTTPKAPTSVSGLLENPLKP